MRAMILFVSVLSIYAVSGLHGSHHEANTTGIQVGSWILNQPLAFQSHQASGIVDAWSDSAVMAQTEAIINLYRKNHDRGGDGGTDNEIVDAIGTFTMRP